MLCPICSLQQPTEGRFCEDCGADLAPPPAAVCAAQTCPQCGAGPWEVDDNGFCKQCGHERIAPRRDHLEVKVSSRLAGVSDRGQRHHRNEDFLALAAGSAGEVLVVCDGVSSSQNPDTASLAAAEAACAVLLQHLNTGTADVQAAMVAALSAAQTAVRKLPYSATEQEDPPETTLVAVARRQRTITLGWLGDSRAYYLQGDNGRLLTVDHSWVNEIVAAGKMSAAEALQSPKAHCITRSIGGPVGSAATGDEPSLATVEVPVGSGYLLLCTDGLWNYSPDPEYLAKLVQRLGSGGDTLALARSLVNYALQRGGRDNITAALLAL